jgi:hypothetical protein
VNAEIHAPVKSKFELQLVSRCMSVCSFDRAKFSFFPSDCVQYMYICLILTVVMEVSSDQKCGICEYESGLFKWYFIPTNFTLLLILT